MSTWYRQEGEAITLTLHVQPGAKQSEIAGLHDDALKIRLAAQPLEGRANEALLHFIAECFAVAPRHVQLVRGSQSRLKVVRVSGSRVEPESLLNTGK